MKDLLPVDSNLRRAVAQAGVAIDLPVALCSRCYTDVKSKYVANKNPILAKEQRKKEHRKALWKQRVSLFKRGKRGFQNKILSEATMAYEQYLTLLEKVFEVEKGQLSPEKFKSISQRQELTIISSVYWDLLRIYDSNPKYKESQKEAAKQLAKFAPHTPVFPDIIRKAKAFKRKSNNPEVLKEFIKTAQASRPRCFIATSAFESPLAEEVQVLAWYRDYSLSQNPWGRTFIKAYYLISPGIAQMLDRCPILKPPLRQILRIMANRVGRRRL